MQLQRFEKRNDENIEAIEEAERFKAEVRQEFERLRSEELIEFLKSAPPKKSKQERAARIVRTKIIDRFAILLLAVGAVFLIFQALEHRAFN